MEEPEEKTEPPKAREHTSKKEPGRLCREVAGPGSRRGRGEARIPGGDRPDAPARVGSPAERTGCAAPLAGASGRSAGDAKRPDIDATASEKTSLWLHKRD
jgi:hypothetical protein